ncbi:hypothetical protein TELCIR_09187 [Teladorsagia circumcincta]|uniref:Uncharacterized protein n=1 Tax=Teladorsagia circumcincta TaxID=45464 RepID=A0A2G9UFP7_TELCI|nr:hypothetical protein TELCIR_09187 [Teladorsagia circumcincta]
MGPARPSAVSDEDKPSEATVIRVLPPASATAMPSPAKPTGSPEGLLRDLEELSHGNAQVNTHRGEKETIISKWVARTRYATR